MSPPAVTFARVHNLRLVVKGGGHSYLGGSNAPDSLLVWTYAMRDIEVHDAFVPRGCGGVVPPTPAVSLGAGCRWIEAYDAVTTRAGRYVQGGGCTTVGVAGLVLGGGFGSFSKRYGTGAAGLLEAEVVTADGVVRIANARNNSDLFWASRAGAAAASGRHPAHSPHARRAVGGRRVRGDDQGQLRRVVPPPGRRLRRPLRRAALQRPVGRTGRYSEEQYAESQHGDAGPR